MPAEHTVFDSVTVDQYNDCIKHYLDNELNGILFNLSEEEKNQFFQMITDYSPLLDKMFFLPGAPFTNFVRYGNEFYEALLNPHEGIDYTPSWIVAEYKEWLTKNNKPFPEDLVVKQGLDLTPLINFQQEKGIVPTTN